MNEAQITAYAAGLFDGGGVVVVGVSRRKRSSTHWLQVSISADRRVLEMLRDAFGGHIVLPRSTARAPTWRVLGHEAVVFLARIRPLLLARTEQADLAIAFQNNRRHIRSLSVEERAEELARRAGIKARLEQLSRRRKRAPVQPVPSPVQVRFPGVLSR